MINLVERRKDSKGRVLKEGENERKQGGYQFRWRTPDGKRHTVYAPTLKELREKEEKVRHDMIEGIRPGADRITINDIYALWVPLKKGIKENTFRNYRYMYELFVQPEFGKSKITEIRKSDVRRFYNSLVDNKGLKISTVDSIHTVLHQVLDLAVEDMYIRVNPSDGALVELKRVRGLDSEKRKALTKDEQVLFLTYLRNEQKYQHWYPVFTVMLGTGMRVGEVTGLRWQDIDLDKRIISVNHTLVYYSHGKNEGCTYAINTPKTKNSHRIVPMIDSVYEAFMLEKQLQDASGLRSRSIVDGYQGFIFVNRFGDVKNSAILNKALNRIIRDCNESVLHQDNAHPIVLLPHFSCHSLRHTFTTRLCEANMNIKVIQDILGHSDIRTTMDIYTDVTAELKTDAISMFNAATQDLFSSEMLYH